jgi:hypothetical protein
VTGGPVSRCQDRLSEALNQWDAADSEACRNVCGLLEEAIAELDRARKGMSPAARSLALVLQLGRVRTDSVRLARLIGASQAFCRGMAAFGGTAATAAPTAIGDA